MACTSVVTLSRSSGFGLIANPNPLARKCSALQWDAGMWLPAWLAACWKHPPIHASCLIVPTCMVLVIHLLIWATCKPLPTFQGELPPVQEEKAGKMIVRSELVFFTGVLLGLGCGGGGPSRSEVGRRGGGPQEIVQGKTSLSGHRHLWRYIHWALRYLRSCLQCCTST